MSATYIRKARGGYRVVHKEQPGSEQSTTVIAPLERSDAQVVRETFKRRK